MIKLNLSKLNISILSILGAVALMGCGLKDAEPEASVPCASGDTSCMVPCETDCTDSPVQADTDVVSPAVVNVTIVNTNNSDNTNTNNAAGDDVIVGAAGAGGSGAGGSGGSAGTAGTAGTGGSGCDTGCDSEPTVTEYLPAVFKSGAPYVLDVSIAYISGSPCGELRGNLPGMSWEAGPFVQDADVDSGVTDGYLGTCYVMEPGSYEMSYVDRECDSEVPQYGNWADYGNLQWQLTKMRSEDLAFIYCTQYDADANSCVEVSDPGCKIAFTVDGDGNISPDGNMEGLNSSVTNCGF